MYNIFVKCTIDDFEMGYLSTTLYFVKFSADITCDALEEEVYVISTMVYGG